jgi:AraC-like DNA-binding protein
MHCDCELYVDLGGDAARLSVVLEQVGGQFEIRRKNWSVHSSTVNAPRPLSLIPAGLQAHASANGVRFLRHLIVQFDMTALDLMVEDEIDLKKVFAPRFMFAEPSIMHLAQLFADECAADAPHARLYGDNLSIALVLALSRLSSPNALSTNPRACLASWQLRRLNEYVNAHLGEDLPLNALSDLVNLSRSYFSRAFKISTGLAPHQWVRQTRIAKAKQLMVETDAPIAQIAIIVGFADQAHFTRNFGDAVGESPANWRRNRLT